MDKPSTESHIEEAPAIAIVGIGNCLRSDDGIAQVLLKSLPSDLVGRHKVFDIGIHTQLIRECLSDFSHVVVIDASLPMGSPGKVCILDLSTAHGETPSGQNLRIASSHGLSIADELSIFKLSSRKAINTKVILFAVEAFKQDFGSTISEELSQRLPDVRAKLLALITELTPINMCPSSKGCLEKAAKNDTECWKKSKSLAACSHRSKIDEALS